MPEQDARPQNPLPLTPDTFWQASLALYQRPGMQAQLLNAQDTQGRNVNLELLRLLLEGEPVSDGYQVFADTSPLSDIEYQQLQRIVSAFSESHTQKIRALRRELSQSDALDQKSRDELKSQLLAAELSLEKQEQAILINALNDLRTES